MNLQPQIFQQEDLARKFARLALKYTGFVALDIKQLGSGHWAVVLSYSVPESSADNWQLFFDGMRCMFDAMLESPHA